MNDLFIFAVCLALPIAPLLPLEAQIGVSLVLLAYTFFM